MKSSLSKWIEHLVKRELYGNGTKEEVIRMLKDVQDKIIKEMKSSHYVSTKAEYQKILKAIEDILSEYSDSYKDILRTQIADISETESEWLQSFMKELGKDFIIPATLFASLKFSPVATSTNYEQLVNSSVLRMKTNVDTALRTSYLIKESTTDTAARLSKRLEKEITSTESDVEVFNTTAFSMTDYLMYRANKEKVRYTAILDSKTCIGCGEMDGQIFEMSKAPVLPQHYNCRCALTPIEIEETQTYSEWFEEQPDDVKRQILGKTRYTLYKEKGIDVSNFVNSGVIIPLSELKLD